MMRDYNPALGRYIESDPIGLSGTSTANMNLFGYANQNPVRFTDPMGESVFGDLWQEIQSEGQKGWNKLNSCSPAPNATNDATNALPPDNNDPRCEKAKIDARRLYNDLTKKRIPQYETGGTKGPDPKHYGSIKQRQNALNKELRRVKLYCNPLPPEYSEWERIANQSIPILHR